MDDSYKIRQGDGEGVFEYYVRIYNHFYEKYGSKIAVMLEAGKFYEIYGIDNEHAKVGNIIEVAEILNIKVAKKTETLLMAGFQPPYFDKYAPLLLEEGYTIILADQITEKPNIIRQVTRVISSSTYLEDGLNTRKSKSKVLCSLYFEFNKKNEIISISMSSVDLTIGSSCLYSCLNDTKTDKERCMDECYRFIHSKQPIEIIFYYDNSEEKELIVQKIRELNIQELQCLYHIQLVPKEYTKIGFQNTFLNEIFKNRGMLDSIEYLNLSKYPSLITNYVLLLNFAYQHDERIVRELHYPKFWDATQYLILENNSMYQLNLVKTHVISDSLVELLDYTSTPLGKRLHKERLLNPIVNTDILEMYYEQIDWTMNKIDTMEDMLKQVVDVERLHRKIENDTIHPFDFKSLEKCYYHIHLLMERFNNYLDEYEGLDQILPFWNQDIYKKFLYWRECYNTIFCIERCNSRKDSIDEKIFQDGIDTRIDEIQSNILEQLEYLQKISTTMSNYIQPYATISNYKKGKKSSNSTFDNEETDSSLVKLEKNDKEGYYISVTNKRAKLVEMYAEKELSKLDCKKLEYKKQISNTKITCDKIKNINEELNDLKEELASRSREVFSSKVKELYNVHKSVFEKISIFISEVDWMKSSAKCAKINYYCRPIIQSFSKSNPLKSYLKAKNMRHPMIEKVLHETHYVPNDISLGTEADGILLFGTNSSGKSSLMKSVGVNIIMAQSGLYVPCTDFVFYPYKNILTRIAGDDNFSKGFSSFVVEMTELRTILNRSDENSLVLGDEICHGTEQVSALAIVASSIIELSKKNTSFIFATHLHKLSDMSEISSLHNVKSKHLKVIYNEDLDRLEYDRKLDDGPGSDVYGLEVAKCVIQQQPEFIKRCFDLRRNILEIPKEFIVTKASKYNTKKIVHTCEICGKLGEDTHHINFQCTADDDGTIDSTKGKFHKNVKANLVSLCKKCHINVHHSIDGKKIEIKGYIQTSQGTILKHQLVYC